MIIRFDKNNSPAEIYLQDFSLKLTESVNKMNLVCMLSEENTIYLIFTTQTLGDDVDYIDDLEMINHYLKSDF